MSNNDIAKESPEVFIIPNVDSEVSENRKKVNESEKEYAFEDALDVIGYGKVQITVLFACGIILMCVINETMGMMIIGIASQCDLDMTSQQKGLLSACSFIGILITSHLWGYLSDTSGRRKIIIYSLFATNICTTLSAFINNYWLFIFVRLLAGVSISGPSATMYAYLGEFNTHKYRTMMISWASTFVGVATIYMPGIAWLILPQTWSFPIYSGLNFRPWQLLLILYTAPGFIAALCLLKLPESPKFLLSRGKTEEALKIAQWIYVTNTGKPLNTFKVHRLKNEMDKQLLHSAELKKGGANILRSVWNQTVPLFKRPFAKNFSICCVIQFGLFFCSAGMGLWYPEIQNRISSVDETSHLTVCTIVEMTTKKIDLNNMTAIQVCNDVVNPKTFIDSMMLGVFYVIGYMILAILINPIGRKIVLPSLLIGSGISGFLLQWITEPIAVVVLFCLFLMLSGLCVSVVNGAVVDLIPTHLRGMAVCMSLMMGRLGSIVGSNIVGFILEINCSVTFLLFAAFVTMCGILAMFLPSKRLK